MATILITGGTGMIGSALTQKLLDNKHQVVILSRASEKRKSSPGITYATWDIDKGEIDRTAIERADHIIHLAGANVGEKRWTKKRKEEIVHSRVASGNLLVKSLREIPNKVQSFISASAIGWYGEDRFPSENNSATVRAFVEQDPPAADFLGETCVKWEASVSPVESMNKRLVILRTGIVLSKKGGALEEFRKPLRVGVATILGDGKQIISWIHIDDLTDIYLRSVESTSMNGVYNAVAPQPVSNKELVLALARSMRKKFVTVKVPAFALKIAIGEMSIEVLKSATVSAGKLVADGFRFSHGDIVTALSDLK